MNKLLKLSGFVMTLLFASNSFGGELYCGYKIGEAPMGPFNPELCELIKKDCVPEEFSNKFQSVDFLVSAKVNPKTEAIDWVMVNDIKDSGKFEQASKDSFISGISADWLKKNPIEGVSPDMQLSWHVEGAMCMAIKKFTSIAIK